ncbi:MULTISPECIES: tRNA uridine-5-carboxymethylaminomethyl(34) synthesis GTPase MnmE [unclassified Ruminococcus]|uniref:tRNA uridine-5-carboxymethylaminomethyl(34) synthesis GTPase MnmE n=1 Tax=unclassified Ruminococcus TaxID=2608920 RepID=UPI00210AE0B2|nr:MULTISPECIES: tRNA uridine-5-carboxymethylaminomethyl(34) synthesis GTPase MnmE [unclassified Ruminococcus]MCQ4021955.1 tRNA uridine-5-carboxymethylaminomethyl(34) synthesis GTPase MnmE [Ruminococcus sp. zg-924]MCQ4114491.1 tRNA uridine-5-carboxymethylaminomethyl(34) synthesis GTPase MnmE [Ruminococcus sp. zg-921]
MLNKTIAAISTAQGAGGIGVIRISGDDAISIADRVFKGINKKPLSEYDGYKAGFGYIYDDDEKLDEAVALVFRAPHSYTGENVVELSCHGGIYITKIVLRAVLNSGAVPAEPGEFTKRAFLNGKIDLTESEAVMGIISAKGQAAARAALCCKEGNLRAKLDKIASSLIDTAAHISAWVDFPEEDVPEVEESVLIESFNNALTELNGLIKSYDSGKAVTQGINTVIVGKPNVGKSTLMNLLSGCERSIVTDIPGTTRDIIEETVTLGNVILRLSDTAGLRETDNAVEKIGVEKTRERLERCGLVIAVFDGSIPLETDDIKLLEKIKYLPAIAVINKSDLGNSLDVDKIKKYVPNIVEISAKEGIGLTLLTENVEKLCGTENFNPSDPILANERQLFKVKDSVSALQECIDALNTGFGLDAVSVALNDAIDSLLEITGKKAAESVVDAVFENFCVGK